MPSRSRYAFHPCRPDPENPPPSSDLRGLARSHSFCLFSHLHRTHRLFVRSGNNVCAIYQTPLMSHARGCATCAHFTPLPWGLGTLFAHFCAFCFCCSDGPGLFDFTQVSYFSHRRGSPSGSSAPCTHPHKRPDCRPMDAV